MGELIREKTTLSILKNTDCVGWDYNSVPQNVEINDIRLITDFKKHAFGGYQKSKVVSTLDKEITLENVNNSCYLAIQLMISGVIEPLWNKYLAIAAKQINIANPLMPVFLLQKTLVLKSNILNKKQNQVLQLRNNSVVRNLIVEMTSLLTLSRKRKLEVLPKIKNEDFIVTVFQNKLEAKDTTLVNNFIQNEDPSEVRIAINEFAHHLRNRNNYKSLYWLNWILEWEKMNRKKYNKFEVAQRIQEGVDSKFSKCVIWLVWKIINTIRTQKSLELNISVRENNQIDALWSLFRYEFTIGKQSVRVSYIIWAIKYMTSQIDWKIPLVERESLHFQAIANVNLIIKNMKGQEVKNNLYDDMKYNLAVHNHYIQTESHDTLKRLQQEQIDKKKREEDVKLQKALKKEQLVMEKMAKQKKITLLSMKKLDALNNIDIF